jgi:hypothetical protein
MQGCRATEDYEDYTTNGALVQGQIKYSSPSDVQAALTDLYFLTHTVQTRGSRTSFRWRHPKIE